MLKMQPKTASCKLKLAGITIKLNNRETKVLTTIILLATIKIKAALIYCFKTASFFVRHACHSS
jgi:hypothetical protein